jgi:hypothetical protein
MAKKGGKSSGKVSAGIHSNVSTATKRAMRAAYLASGDRIINHRKAFDAGKNVMLTIPNPNSADSSRRFIRVPASQVWNNFKKSK